MMSAKPVLYADDDENDLFFMERAFEKLNLPQPLRTVPDGKQAIAYLEGKPPYANREENPLPCLVFLDLSMPGRNGLDVLQWIRSQPNLVGIPVIAFTSSNQESDIHRAYLLGANGFLVKPGDPDDLIRIVKGVQQYWLSEYRPAGPFVDVAAIPPPPDKSPKT
jgi:CheY-like chemotaxis protein